MKLTNDGIFSQGDTLIWEYPRDIPDGDQINILEFMKIKNNKIIKDRIYGGWFGVQLLLKNQSK